MIAGRMSDLVRRPFHVTRFGCCITIQSCAQCPTITAIPLSSLLVCMLDPISPFEPSGLNPDP